MLEQDGSLRTWRLLDPPKPEQGIAAEALADHRPEYLEYEGPVSGGRGHVRRWDAGDYEIAAESDRELELRLNGSRLCGRGLLSRSGDGERWTFYFRTG